MKNSQKFLALIMILLSFGANVLAVSKNDSKAIDEDRKERYWPGGKHGFKATNLEYAAGEINSTLAPLIAYIFYCKRFPLNLEDAYKARDNAPKGCESLKPWDYGIETPWIDPWGRAYQIRYHKERRKLQMRSQGRKLDDPTDDIVRETLWGNAAIIFNNEIEKCKKLSKDDKSCAFNRGWH